jgi:ABC-2 type transport system permease protein
MVDALLTPHDSLWLPAISLCRRELVRFVRQRNRIVGALATPLVFWLLIGAGMGRSFQASSPGGDHYLRYFYPGTLLMILLFTAIFSTISIIEDRREGFLQSVLIAPVSKLAIVLGKVLGGTILAFAQGLIFLLLAPTIGIRLSAANLGVTMLVMLIVGFGLTALGFCIAWRMSSTQGFHAIMNLFLMPMWFLSGALFPMSGAWTGLKWIMYLNPLTYGLAALRRALYLDGGGLNAGAIPPLPVALLVSIAFAVVMLALSVVVVRGRVASDLQ